MTMANAPAFHRKREGRFSQSQLPHASILHRPGFSETCGSDRRACQAWHL